MIDYKTLPNTIALDTYLKRDPEHIKQLLTKTKDNRVVTKKALDVMFPETYIEKNLAKIDGMMECLGIVALIDPDAKKYALFMIPARIVLPIAEMVSYTNQEETYRVLRYQAYDTVLQSSFVISDDKLSYWLYDYFVALARVPWYMEYEDLLRLYDQDGHYVKVRVSPLTTVVEMILANIARNPRNDGEMYRHVLTKPTDIKTIKPRWIPLKNISMGVADSFSKVMGAYYDEGLTSALASDSKIQTEIERILRE